MKMNIKAREILNALVFLVVALPCGGAFAEVEVVLKSDSLDSYRQELGFEAWRLLGLGSRQERQVKIAVLDKGFQGWSEQAGRTLPENVEHFEGPIAADKETIETPHGRLMAEILSSLLWGSAKTSNYKEGPAFKLSLYNVAGFTNFKSAIDSIIKDKVDIVLYSEVWELGGNSDGQGFINKEVTRAIRSGVLWINAAGNFSGRTYNGGIEVGTDDWLKLPNQNSALEINCRPLKEVENCNLRLVLTWNDFKDDTEKGTSKDLDLVLMDDLLNVKAVSQLKQTQAEGEAKAGESKYPRESLSIEIPKGKYFVKVKSRSKTWTSRDRLRITADGDFLDMPKSTTGETLLNPADNVNAVTVGAWDSDRSSRSFQRGKPEILAPSSVKDQKGKEFRGSSNAAAMVAAAAVLLKSHYPQMTREGFLRSIGSALAPKEPEGTRYFSMPPIE
jgi:hypothetical protein